MGTVANTTDFERVSYGAPESAGTGRQMKMVTATVALSSSYATGGDTLAVPTDMGTLVTVLVAPEIKSSTDVVTWNGSTSTPKLQAWAESTGTLTEATAASNQSTKTRQVTLIFVK